MKFIFLMQARLGSTRRPGKMLTPIKGDTTLFETVYNRVLLAKEVVKDNFYVVTSDSLKDDPLVELMKVHGMLYARGDEQNVYKRFFDFLLVYNPKPDYIIRVCADNPFLEPEFINEMTDFLQNTKEPLPDYLTYMDSKGRSSMGTQYGFFAEAILYDAYVRANDMNLTDNEKEHVTSQFYKSGKFSTKFLSMPKEIELHPYRFTVDTENDLNVVRIISSELPEKFSYHEVIAVAQRHPDVMNIMAEAVSGDKKVGR